MTDIYPELVEDLQFDWKDLKTMDAGEVEWEKVRAVRRKSFEMKAKSEKLNEFTLARSVYHVDDAEDKERANAETCGKHEHATGE
ncbi:Hypothetical protein NTJ_09966 [Nesidiocoris tenuis]|nr:Hypothetical protein NTJ_09966 [Nesidiocoris tenuis]